MTEARSATPVKKKTAKKKAEAGLGETSGSHPPISQMVPEAIKVLKERSGSSTQAIKKYIASTYKYDTQRKSHFINKFLIKAVESGILIRTRGKGPVGSFKLPVKEKNSKKASTGKEPPGKKPASKAKKPTEEKPEKIESATVTKVKKTSDGKSKKRKSVTVTKAKRTPEGKSKKKKSVTVTKAESRKTEVTKAKAAKSSPASAPKGKKAMTKKK